jgi:hypothetical protein
MTPTPFAPVRVRRVVTAMSGGSVILSDGDAPTVANGEGRFGTHVVEMWQTRSTPPSLSGEDLSALAHQTEPVPGGIHWRIVTFPERDAPGYLHRTNSVDLLYIISGQIILSVGDDEDSLTDSTLTAGDAVVALGNLHAWRNAGPGPCVTVVTMVSSLPTSGTPAPLGLQLHA